MKSSLLILFPLGLMADTLTLTDGTFLKGKIERITGGVVEMNVPILGSALQKIPVASVESFTTEEKVSLSNGGPVLNGVASAAAKQAASSGGAETMPVDAKLELWRDNGPRPSEAIRTRKWKMQADLDVSGRSGSTTGSGISAGFQAKGTRPEDTINTGVRVTRAKSGDKISADDLHVLLGYETNPIDVLYWYVRTDTGYDHARSVDLLSVNAAGLGFRLYTDDKGKLDARLGLAHRYEKYSIASQPNLSKPSADLGLILHRELGWAALDSSVSIIPTLEDVSDYYLRHESSLNLLRGESPLSLRIGVSNDFRSKPLPTQVQLDTAYFVRMVYAWK